MFDLVMLCSLTGQRNVLSRHATENEAIAALDQRVAAEPDPDAPPNWSSRPVRTAEHLAVVWEEDGPTLFLFVWHDSGD